MFILKKIYISCSILLFGLEIFIIFIEHIHNKSYFVYLSHKNYMQYKCKRSL